MCTAHHGPGLQLLLAETSAGRMKARQGLSPRPPEMSSVTDTLHSLPIGPLELAALAKRWLQADSLGADAELGFGARGVH